MARSICGKCGQSRWELQAVTPNGAAYKYYFVQCAACGVVVNTVEWTNAGAVVGDAQKKILDAVEEVNNKVAHLQSQVARIAQGMRG